MQILNWVAIGSIWRVVANPALAIPHLRVADLREVRFDLLKRSGISAVVFDKDNTLTAPFADEIFPTLKVFSSLFKDA
jgi:phosphatidylglycerophosphatase GEP4